MTHRFVSYAVLVASSLIGSACSKSLDSPPDSPTDSPTESVESPSVRPGASSAPAASSVDRFGPLCEQRRRELFDKATPLQRCTPGAQNQCLTCVVAPHGHCGILVNDAQSQAAKEYFDLSARVARECGYPPMTTSPACAPVSTGACGPDGTCSPKSCTIPGSVVVK